MSDEELKRLWAQLSPREQAELEMYATLYRQMAETRAKKEDAARWVTFSWFLALVLGLLIGVFVEFIVVVRSMGR